MSKRLASKFSALWRRVSPEHRQDYSLEELSDTDSDRHAKEIVTHSRLAWSPSEPSSFLATSLRGKITTAHGDRFDLEEDSDWHLERYKVHEAFRESDGSSLMGSISTIQRSPSLPGGHHLALGPQAQPLQYAHFAWKPPGEFDDLNEEEECRKRRSWFRALLERCKDRVICGQFDEAVVGRYYRKSYCYRTTPQKQQSASRSFVQMVEARTKAKRTRFEQDQMVRRATARFEAARSDPPLVRERPNEYRVEFSPGVSDFGDFAEELWRHVGVPNLL